MALLSSVKRLPVTLLLAGARCSTRLSSKHGAVKKTVLYDFHVAHGGKMVDFAGWSMPVQYSDLSITASHLHTREHVSVFDVSHMLQTAISGRDQVEFIENLVVGDVGGLAADHGTLTLFTNDQGGIIDDLIVTRTSRDHLYIVSNAACAENDFNHMSERASEFRARGKDVTVEILTNGLLAVQGPEMQRALQDAVDVDLTQLYFMTSAITSLFDVPNCRITRCGYTGEDGVEISIPSDYVVYVAERLLASTTASVKLAGLGARDSLRLEAGLCLYGSDIDNNTTPVEATLAWTIGKRRRSEGNFPGSDVILKQISEKPKRKRVGFLSSGPTARGGTRILDESGSKEIGCVTSGCPSPSLKQNVAMGYVDAAHAANGCKVKFDVRKKLVDASVAKMPFVQHRYYVKK